MKTITIDGIEYQLTPITTEAPKPVQWETRRLHTLNNYYSFDTDMKVFSTPETQHLLDMARAQISATTSTLNKKPRKLLNKYVNYYAYVLMFVSLLLIGNRIGVALINLSGT